MRPVTRAVRGLSLLAVSAVVLVGCAGGQPQPREYGEVNTNNEGYYGNFMLGCTGVEANGSGDYVPEDGEQLLMPVDYCRCVFEGMKETVPFAEARVFEEAQADAEEGSDITIPKAIQSVMDDCSSGTAEG